ncbi:MAG: hypothetical protein RBR08_16660 [Desulforegulaceae bacterium]|nr:hypothetical protein [Desulforegulaceae bacterium]
MESFSFDFFDKTQKFNILKKASLVSPESKKQAWYEVRIYGGDGLFYVVKESGATGASGLAEAWVRPSEEQALKKFDTIIKKKLSTAKSRARRYVLKNG